MGPRGFLRARLYPGTPEHGAAVARAAGVVDAFERDPGPRLLPPPGDEPATARLVRSGSRARPRTRAGSRLVRRWRLCGGGWAICARPDVAGADGWRVGRHQRAHWRLRLELQQAQVDCPIVPTEPRAQHGVDLGRVDRAAVDDGLSDGDAGRNGRHWRARWRIPRRNPASENLAALALPPGLGTGPVLGASNAFRVRLQQPVEVDDDIFHLGIVDRALGGAAPGLLCRRIAVVEPNKVNIVEIDEVQTLRILDPTAEYEVKLAHGRLPTINCGGCECSVLFGPDGGDCCLRRCLGCVPGALQDGAQRLRALIRS